MFANGKWFWIDSNERVSHFSTTEPKNNKNFVIQIDRFIGSLNLPFKLYEKKIFVL